MDGQSVKTTERGGIRGFDAQKRVKGRKRHILVDTFRSSPHAEWSRLTSLIETPYSQPPRTGLRLFKHPLRTETEILGKRWQLSSSAIPAILLQQVSSEFATLVSGIRYDCANVRE